MNQFYKKFFILMLPMALKELISSLTLELNHARQSAITTEISEIVGGSAMMQQQ